jgi:hypothetical protein
MANKVLPQELDHYFQLGLTLIPPKPRSKEPLVKWDNGSDFLFPRADGGPMSIVYCQRL